MRRTSANGWVSSSCRTSVVGSTPAADELGREAVGGLPGRAEAHGVGDEARVEAARDVDVERHAQRRQHAVGDDDRGLRIRVEQLDVAEAGVGDVVVDHDRDAGGVERRRPARRAGRARRRRTPPRRPGAAGTADGGTTRPSTSRGRNVSGISSGVAKATRTTAPRRRRAMPSASALPSESASGCTCASSVTSAASASTSAAVRKGSAANDAPRDGSGRPEGA